MLLRLFKVSIILILISYSVNGQSNEDWQDLLSEENISNWRIKIRFQEIDQNVKNTFYLKENLLGVNYSEYDSFADEFGHIFYDQKLSFYRLKYQYRFFGDQVAGGEGWAFRNNGLMLHSQSPESMLKDQDFPISVEVQLLGGNGDDPRPTGNVCTPGTHVVIDGKLEEEHCIDSSSPTYHGDQWVDAEVIVLGDSLIRHFIEGSLVMEYTKPVVGGSEVAGYDPEVKIDGTSLTSGYVAFQSESHPTEFRNVYLLNLKGCMDPKAENYREYYVEADNSTCKY